MKSIMEKHILCLIKKKELLTYLCNLLLSLYEIPDFFSEPMHVIYKSYYFLSHFILFRYIYSCQKNFAEKERGLDNAKKKVYEYTNIKKAEMLNEIVIDWYLCN